jgi:diguanylate cyclase
MSGKPKTLTPVHPIVVTPVEIARQALHRLAGLGLPPTPENFEAQYRDIAGVPPRAEVPVQPPAQAEPSAAATAQTMDMVRNLLQFMSSTNADLHADLTKFSDQSSSLLAQAGSNRDPKAMGELFEAMTTSSSWLLGQVDNTRQELERTREQLDEVHRELHQAQNEAVSDPLTGLPNRRALDPALSREVARARRNKTPLCVAVIDVDHFKRVNDQYGHAAGDAALVHLAQVLKPGVRETDMLARFGGEEFALVLPETPLVGAEFTMNRLLRAIERAPLTFEGKEIAIRFSAGLAEWHSDESPEQIMQRADEAMYRAKAAGRARVVVSESHPAAAH